MSEESIPTILLEAILEVDPSIESLCMRRGHICGIKKFFTTWGLCVGVTEEIAYERRYCFEAHHEALSALRNWDGAYGTHPGGNWIKCKGRFLGEPIDLLNPNWSKFNAQHR